MVWFDFVSRFCIGNVRQKKFLVEKWQEHYLLDVDTMIYVGGDVMAYLEGVLSESRLD